MGGRARASRGQSAFLRTSDARRARHSSAVRSSLDSGDAQNWFSRGDYDSAVEGSRPLSATYWVAPAQHLGLEPLTATARFSGDQLEVWAPTQAPEFARAAAAEAAGKAASQVTLYPMPVGDPGGRALEADAIADGGRAGPRTQAAGPAQPFAQRQPEPRSRRAGRARPDDRAPRRRRHHRGVEDARRHQRRARIGDPPPRRRRTQPTCSAEPRSTAPFRLMRFPTSASKRCR